MEHETYGQHDEHARRNAEEKSIVGTVSRALGDQTGSDFVDAQGLAQRLGTGGRVTAYRVVSRIHLQGSSRHEYFQINEDGHDVPVDNEIYETNPIVAEVADRHAITISEYAPKVKRLNTVVEIKE